MTSPRQPPSVTKKPRRTRTKRPPQPPAPPRWTLFGNAIRQNAQFIQIDMFTDTPIHATLAWTFVKPRIHARQVTTRGAIREHHNAYSLSQTNLEPQLQPGNTTTHSFLIAPPEGCHNIYYTMFDGTDPHHFHSISPIFALTYCASSLNDFYTFEWQSDGSQGAAIPGDYIIVFRAVFPAGSDVSLTSPDCDITTLQGPTTLTQHSYSNTPPRPVISTEQIAFASYLVKVNNANPVFNAFCAGNLTRYASGTTPVTQSGAQITGSVFDHSTGLTSYSDTIAAIFGSYHRFALEIYNYGAVATVNSTPNTNQGGVNYLDGPNGPINFDGTGTTQDGDVALSSAVYNKPPPLFTLSDITAHWRTYPNPPPH